MSQIATLVAAMGILGLFFLNRDSKGRTSKALWVAVIWISIGASRPVSVWLQIAPPNSVDVQLEGSPLDRNVFLGLLSAGIIVLVTRAKKVATLLRMNRPILLFFAYSALSILWSDYPDVAFKRWTKALGDVVMVLIVLTDCDPTSAVKRLFSRTAFLLMPLSILLIKYYGDLGRYYSRWEGTIMFGGVTTDKNMLGMGCLIMGLALMWHLFQELRNGKRTRRTRVLIANGAVVLMILWLFWKAHSMTSLACFILASGLILVTGFPAIFRRRGVVHVLVVSVVSVVLLALFADAGAGLLQTVGRDSTLTGRTDIWDLVLSMGTNPLLGTGFESFWLGPRLEKIWSMSWWRPNEAHNGYIEIYLNLGYIGVALLLVVIVTGYRNILATLRWDPEIARLKLAYFVVGVAYNFTESAFKMLHLVWIAFLLAVIALPKTRVIKSPRRHVERFQTWPQSTPVLVTAEQASV